MVVKIEHDYDKHTEEKKRKQLCTKSENSLQDTAEKGEMEKGTIMNTPGIPDRYVLHQCFILPPPELVGLRLLGISH